MKTNSTRQTLMASCLVAGGVVLAHGTALAGNMPGNLSVCIDTASASAARDQRVAEAVAHREGVELAVEHFTSGDDDDGFSPKEFRKLISSKCKLVLGFPVDTTQGSSPGLPPDLMTTSAYGETGFVFVVPQGSTAKRLADLPNDTDVAVTYDTAPNTYFLDHKNVSPDVHTSDKETLETVASGKVKAAMVWGPTLQAYLAATPAAKLSAYPLAEPHAQYKVVALYGTDGTAEAARFQTAVADLGGSSALDKTIASDAGGSGEGGGTTTAQPPAASPAPAAGGLPALYTEAQAKQGAQKFSDNCEQCHGAKLQGISGPALKGPNFASKASNFTVSDIFAIVSQNMPASNPGSLQHDDYVQVMAFLLQQNGYPAGSTELTFDGAGASKVALVYQPK